MQTSSWKGGAESPFLYRITQPYVALHYFKEFFLPTDLAVDSGWHYVDALSLQAVAGYLFVALLLGVAVLASRTRRGKPIAFGIFWFFAALLPTSLVPLGDVMNDHRMFFPFVGLTLSVIWSLRLALFHKTARLTANPNWVSGAMLALVLVLMVAGGATRARNRIWFTEETLWRDATLKNPQNPRPWTNYGAFYYLQADYDTALSYWQRAAVLDPTCINCQRNLIRVSMQLHRNDLIDRHFHKLMAMHLPVPQPYTDYAEWLVSVGRYSEACDVLAEAAQIYPNSPDLRRTRIKLYLQRDASDRIPLFKALDTNHDTSLSPGEILAAPAVLISLDKNGDGKLSAEECGANFGNETLLSEAFLRNARKEFMRADPLLRVLDADGDGEISTNEMMEAEKELSSLDSDGDGSVEASEMVPTEVMSAARRVLAMLDRNQDDRIEADEWAGKAGDPFRALLTAADTDGDGVITLQELTNEIFYRGDLDKDGVVTPQEMEQAIRSGLLGPIPSSSRLPAARFRD